MIKNICTKGKIGPLLYCDICGERIKDANMAAALSTKNMSDGESAPVIHVHKGKCHDTAEKKYGVMGWEEMDRHLLQLAYNVGLTVEKMDALRKSDNENGGGLYTYLR